MAKNGSSSSVVKIEILEADPVTIFSPRPKRRFVEFPTSARSGSSTTKTHSLENWQDDFNRTIASIKEKHGAIEKNCILETEHMRKVNLYGVWGLLKGLQDKKLDEIDMNSLQIYYTIARDAEKLNLNMKWLLKRLDEIKDAISSRDEVNLLQAQKDRHMKERETREKELAVLLIQVKEMENRVRGKNMIIKELDGEIKNLASKHEHLQTRPLLDGLV